MFGALKSALGMKSKPVMPPPQMGAALGGMKQGLGPSNPLMSKMAQNVGSIGGMMGGRDMTRPPVDTGIQAPPDRNDIQGNQAAQGPVMDQGVMAAEQNRRNAMLQQPEAMGASFNTPPGSGDQAMMGGLAPRMGAIRQMMQRRPVPRRY